jgi:hypothetical protein
MKQLTVGIMFILLAIYTVLIAPRNFSNEIVDAIFMMISLILISLGFIVIVTQGFDSK